MSCVVSKHNKDLSADTTKNVCRDDVHDRAPVYQGLLSVSFPHTSGVTCEPFVSLQFLTSPLMRGRFDPCLCLCPVSVSVSVSVSV